ncbi:MAG: hypothetical protein E6J41_18040 [Chloroflexi bacterium]|nr:MAG: hypothetical protein E6J41_18040 [Chloroflexota bacterium]
MREDQVAVRQKRPQARRDPVAEVVELGHRVVALGEAPGDRLDVGMARVQLGHQLGVAPPGHQQHVVAGLAQQARVHGQDGLDPAGDRRSGVVDQGELAAAGTLAH